MYILNITPLSKCFLWLTKQNVFINDMTDLVNVVKVGQLKVTTNKMSVIARGNAIEVISLNLCIGTKKHLGCWVDTIKLNLEINNLHFNNPYS